MISEIEFAELSNSLSTGFFADKVIMALARTQRLGRLQKQDKPTLESASKLLDRILQGEKWLTHKKLNTTSVESAMAFDRAVHALPDIKIPADFVAYIEKLKTVIDSLLRNNKVEKGEIIKVRRFFFNYARAVSVESQKVIERSIEPQGVIGWLRPSRGSI